ncbi:MAG: hypothetical protein ACREGE_01535 [Candidatus Microsaccharimonas sp.]
MPTNSKKSKKTESRLKRWLANLKKRQVAFMSRRSHRSFQLSRRREYVRPLALPGNFAFTHEVTRTLWRHRKIFLLLVATYVVFYAVLVGMQSQDTYSTLIDTLKETGQEALSGGWGAIGQASLLLVSIASPSALTEVSEAQQIFTVFIFLLTWLATVWLLRNILAGHKVKLRDGLYNSGSPIFATVIVSLFIAIQLIPVAIALIGYTAALGSGLLDGGAATMLFWIAAALLALLSLYWITSSLFAMIIVTLPGMYPYRALRTAGDLVLGRRTKILLRWLWMMVTIVLAWAVVMIPAILLDMGLKSLWPAIQWLPVIPFFALIMTAGSTVWAAAYVYMLYRKVVDYVEAE